MALEEELKILNFVLWLNCHNFVLFDFAWFISDFVTFLIKFALWNSGKAWEAKAFLQGRGWRHREAGMGGGPVSEDPIGSPSVL